MNAPVNLAQLTTGQPATQGQTVRLERPSDGAAVVIRVEPGMRIDFRSVADDRIVLVRAGDRLIVLFEDRSAIVLQNFFREGGLSQDNVDLQITNDQVLPSAQFVSRFPVSDDLSILPAAGPAAGSSTPGSAIAAVDPTFAAAFDRQALDLLGNLDFGGPNFAAQNNTNGAPVIDLDTTRPGVDFNPALEREAARSFGGEAVAGAAGFTGDPGDRFRYQLNSDGLEPGRVAGPFSQEAPGALPGTSANTAWNAEGIGATIGKVALDGTPLISISDPDGDLMSRLVIELAGTSTGENGVLQLTTAGINLALARGYTVTGLGTDRVDVTSAGGMSPDDLELFISYLRYINTETSFALDIANRTVTVTVVDTAGNAGSAQASIEIIADVNDVDGLNLFVGTKYSDEIDGQDGSDRIDGAGDADNISGGGGGESFRISESEGEVKLTGDVLQGGAGNDVIYGDGRLPSFYVRDFETGGGIVDLDPWTRAFWQYFRNAFETLKDANPASGEPGHRTDAQLEQDAYRAALFRARSNGEYPASDAETDWSGAPEGDHISGDAGDDRIFGDGDRIRLVESRVSDDGIWWRPVANDVISGGTGADIIYGDIGDDRIDGGANPSAESESDDPTDPDFEAERYATTDFGSVQTIDEARYIGDVRNYGTHADDFDLSAPLPADDTGPAGPTERMTKFSDARNESTATLNTIGTEAGARALSQDFRPVGDLYPVFRASESDSIIRFDPVTGELIDADPGTPGYQAPALNPNAFGWRVESRDEGTDFLTEIEIVAANVPWLVDRLGELGTLALEGDIAGGKPTLYFLVGNGGFDSVREAVEASSRLYTEIASGAAAADGKGSLVPQHVIAVAPKIVSTPGETPDDPATLSLGAWEEPTIVLDHPAIIVGVFPPGLQPALGLGDAPAGDGTAAGANLVEIRTTGADAIVVANPALADGDVTVWNVRLRGGEGIDGAGAGIRYDNTQPAIESRLTRFLEQYGFEVDARPEGERDGVPGDGDLTDLGQRVRELAKLVEDAVAGDADALEALDLTPPVSADDILDRALELAFEEQINPAPPATDRPDEDLRAALLEAMGDADALEAFVLSLGAEERYQQALLDALSSDLTFAELRDALTRGLISDADLANAQREALVTLIRQSFQVILDGALTSGVAIDGTISVRRVDIEGFGTGVAIDAKDAPIALVVDGSSITDNGTGISYETDGVRADVLVVDSDVSSNEGTGLVVDVADPVSGETLVTLGASAFDDNGASGVSVTTREHAVRFVADTSRADDNGAAGFSVVGREAITAVLFDTTANDNDGDGLAVIGDDKTVSVSIEGQSFDDRASFSRNSGDGIEIATYERDADGDITTTPSTGDITGPAGGPLLIEYIVADNNGGRGIAVVTDGAIGATIASTTASTNSLDGIQVDGGPEAVDVTLTSATTNDNGDDGIDISATTGAITVTGLTVTADSNDERGIAVDGEGTVTVNLSATNASDNGSDGIEIGGADEAVNVTLTDVIAGTRGTAPTALAGNRGDGIDIAAGEGAITVTGLTINASGNDGRGIAVAGDGTITITAEGVTANENTADGLQVQGDEALVKVTLGDTTLDTDTTSAASTFNQNGGDGIDVTSTGAITFAATNITASTNDLDGLKVVGDEGTVGVTLTNVTTNGNGAATRDLNGDGIDISAGEGAITVTGLTITASDNDGRGIAVAGEGTITFTAEGVTANGNAADGLQVQGDEELVTVTLGDTSLDDGVVASASTFNQNGGDGIDVASDGQITFAATNVTADDNNGNGASVVGTGPVTLQLSNFDANQNGTTGAGTEGSNGDGDGDGLRVRGADGLVSVSITAPGQLSTFNQNRGDGIDVATSDGGPIGGPGSGGSAVLVDVQANANGQNGIVFSSSGTITGVVVRSTASDNLLDGVHVRGAAAAVGLNVGGLTTNNNGASASQQGDGIDIQTTTGPISFFGEVVTANANDGRGIALDGDGTISLSLINSSASSNVNDGIEIDGLTGNVTVRLTYVTTNGNGAGTPAGDGIDISAGDGAITVTGIAITASNNDGRGIAVTGDGTITFTAEDVTANGNAADGLEVDGDEALVKVTLGDTTLDTNTTSQASTFNQNGGDGIDVTSTGAITFAATNVTANSNARDGLKVDGDEGTVGVTLTNVTTNGNGAATGDLNGDGIDISAGDGAITVTGLTINASSNDGRGIAVTGEGTITVNAEGVSALLNAGDGFQVVGATEAVTVTLRDTTLDDGDVAASSTFSTNAGDGIDIRATDGQITFAATNVTASDNAGNGAAVVGSGDVVLELTNLDANQNGTVGAGTTGAAGDGDGDGLHVRGATVSGSILGISGLDLSTFNENRGDGIDISAVDGPITVTVTRVWAVDNGLSGLKIDGADDAVDVTLKSVRTERNGKATGTLDGDGIGISAGDGAITVTAEDLVAHDNDGRGIAVAGEGAVTFSANRFDAFRNASDGLEVDGASEPVDVKLVSAVIIGNGTADGALNGDGIDISATTGAIIFEAVSSGSWMNDGHGIAVTGQGEITVAAEGMQVYSNVGDGLQVVGATEAVAVTLGDTELDLNTIASPSIFNRNGGDGIDITATTGAITFAATNVTAFDNAGNGAAVVGGGAVVLNLTNLDANQNGTVGSGVAGDAGPGDGDGLHVRGATISGFVNGESASNLSTFNQNRGDGIDVRSTAAVADVIEFTDVEANDNKGRGIAYATDSSEDDAEISGYFTNVSASDNALDGIQISAPSAAVDVELDNVTANGNGLSGSEPGDGIDVSAGGEIFLVGEDIRASENDGDGLHVDGKAKVDINLTDASFAANTNDGIDIDGTDGLVKVILDAVAAVENGEGTSAGNGIDVRSTTGEIFVSGTDVTASANDAGIRLEGDGDQQLLLDGASVTNNRGDGIAVLGGDDNADLITVDVTSITVQDNEGRGVYVVGDARDTITYTQGLSAIAGNSLGGLVVEGGNADSVLSVAGATFTNNGNDTSAGDIAATEWIGSASIDDVTVNGNGAVTPANGILISGAGAGVGAGADGVGFESGAISFQNTTVTGSYDRALVNIEGYSRFATGALSFANTTIGGTGSAADIGLLINPGARANIDGTGALFNHAGAFTAGTGDNVVDLTGVTLAGGTYAWNDNQLALLSTITGNTWTPAAFGGTAGTADDDVATAFALAATDLQSAIVGTTGRDIITGTDQGDFVFGVNTGTANDTITTRGGGDVVLTLETSTTANQIDTIDLGEGDDVLLHISGMSGTDRVEGGAGDDLVVVTNATGSDRAGTDATTTVTGGTPSGDVTVTAATSGVINRTSTVVLTGGVEALSVVMTHVAADTADGETLIVTGSFADTDLRQIWVRGGAGDDTLDASGTANSGAPVIISNDETLTALWGNWSTATGFEKDRTGLGAGNDLFKAGATSAADSVDGGEGIDTADYGALATDITIELDTNLADAEVRGRAFGGVLGSGADALAQDNLRNFENAFGGAGNDTLIGSNAANVLDGKGGNDTLVGHAGNDTLIGGAGIDTVDYSQEDTLNVPGVPGAGERAIIVNLSGSHRTDLDGLYTATARDNTSDSDWTGLANNALRALDTYGNVDTLNADIENVVGTTESDVIVGSDVVNRVEGGDGNDYIEGREGGDTLIGGAGDDVIIGEGATGQAVATYGADRIEGGAGSDLIFGDDENAGADVASGEADTIIGGTGGTASRVVAGVTYMDEIYGGGGGDTIYADNEGVTASTDSSAGDADFVAAGGGDDTIYGGGGADRLLGEAGADSVFGQGGDDTVVGGTTGSARTIPGVTGSFVDALYGGAGNDVISGDDEGAGSMLAEADYIEAGDGTDTVYGGGGDDRILGGQGADTLHGEDGDDTIVGGTGGSSRIYRNSESFASATVVDVILGGAGNDTIYGDGEEIGSTLFEADLIEGGTGNDTIYAGNGQDRVGGGEGADTIYGEDGNDVILGGRGGDGRTISGVSGTFVDAIFGGNGRDTIHGDLDGVIGPGDDADYIDAGDGADAVFAGGGNDRVLGGEGADRIFGEDGDDTIVGGQGGDPIGLDPVTVDFIEGGAGNDTIYGDTETTSGGVANDEGDEIYAGAGSDLVFGGGGGDVIHGGEGGDAQRAASSAGLEQAITDAINWPAVDPLFVDVLVGGDGDDAIVDGEPEIGPAPRDDAGIDTDLLIGGAGNDILFGQGGNDVLLGGSGNNTMRGGTGSDRFIVFAADAATDTIVGGEDTPSNETDTIELWAAAGGTNVTITARTSTPESFGIAYDNVASGAGSGSVDATEIETLVFQGGAGTDALTIRATWVGDTITITGSLADATITLNGRTIRAYNIESLTIDGLTRADTIDASGFTSPITINGGAGADTLTGGSGADTINGQGGDDTIVGGGGNDTINGQGGDDTIVGGGGDDTINGQRGDDTIVGGLGDDTLNGGTNGAVSFTRTGNETSGGAAAILASATGGDTVDYSGVSTGVLANISATDPVWPASIAAGTARDRAPGTEIGNDTLRNIENLTGGTGDDVLVGGAGANILRGGAGSDTLLGGAGNDLLVGGDDTVVDGIYAGAGDDVLILGNGGGTAKGEGGNDLIFGGTGSDWLYGEDDGNPNPADAGNDIIFAGDGGDHVEGNAGDDQLHGENGNDTLVGGLGDDTIHGGAGDDLVRYTAGDGADIVDGGSETGSANPNYDVFRFQGDGEARTITLTKGALADASNIVPDGETDAQDVLLTYDGTGGTTVRMDGIERIEINAGTGALTTNLATFDRTGTAIAPSTIVVNGGSSGEDRVIFGEGGTGGTGFYWDEMTFTRDGSTIVASHQGGTFRVTNVEHLQFRDGTVSLGDGGLDELFDRLIDVDPNTLALSNASVAENAGPGAVVGTFTFADRNPLDTWQVRVLDAGGNTSGDFSLRASATDPRSFELIASGSFDFETKASYDIKIQVSDDEGVTWQTLERTITVTDVNEAPTDLVVSNLVSSVTENTPITAGTPVATLAWSDDALGSETITLTGADAGLFEVSGNNIVWKDGFTPDFETKSSYDLGVSVADASLSGSTPLTASLAITVTDVNEPPTNLVVSNRVSSVTENTPITAGTRVATLAWSDDALGSETITLTGADAGLFEVSGNNIVWKNGVTPDFETKASYDLGVSVADASLSGASPLTASLAITVTDVNEAPPAARDPSPFFAFHDNSKSPNMIPTTTWATLFDGDVSARTFTSTILEPNGQGEANWLVRNASGFGQPSPNSIGSGDTDLYVMRVDATQAGQTPVTAYAAITILDGTTRDVTNNGDVDDEDGDLIRVLDGTATTVSAGDGDDVVVVNTASGRTIKGEDGDDAIYGGAGNDTLEGGDDEDFLVGGAGNDIIDGDDDGDWLFGGAGNDRLEGGGENDVLVGGAGADTFLFGDQDDGGDTILDFSGEDVIEIDGSDFGLGSFAGLLSGHSSMVSSAEDVFRSFDDPSFNWSQVNDATRFIALQLPSLTQLWFNPSGGGLGNRELLVTLENGHDITASQIRSS